MVIPVEQTCPKCGSRFMGSDCIGDSCSSCRMGYLDLSLDYLMRTDSPAQPEEPSDAPCSHPSYSWSALGVTCAHCGAEGWHAANGEIVWRLPHSP